MAHTIDKAVELCLNVQFERKIKVVMAFIADEVLSEPSNVPFHAIRVRWANRALNRPMEEVKKVCLILSLNPRVDTSTDDVGLITAVRAKVNAFAGAAAQLTEPADGTASQITIKETDHDNNPKTSPIVTKRTFFNPFRRNL